VKRGEDVIARVGVIGWAIPRREFHTYLQRLVDAGVGRRILFGSDQMLWPEALEGAIRNVEGAPYLIPRQKRDILHRNAVRFLRLPEGRVVGGAVPRAAGRPSSGRRGDAGASARR
jgi:predicted TIM-barrel fold metal-dependent hydrolase